jgi:hypothetical protein
MKESGGSIKVGTIGKVSDLMWRELDDLNSEKRNPHTLISSRRRNPKHNPIVSTGESSASCSNKNNMYPKNKHNPNPRKPHQIPILNSKNISLDSIPTRKIPNKKGPYLVEIVDIKCRNPDITSRLKKLGFSKLSQTFV